jgi:TonB-linked SusC/RagA family outer membrane protein
VCIQEVITLANQINPKHLKMKRRNLLFTVLFILFHVAVFAQSRVIKGIIADSETKEGIPGVGILVVGSTTATTSDVNGAYTITVEGEGKKLIFSYVGYANQTVDADKEAINITLMPSSTVLDETVVTALGVSREKKTLGYATQEISGDKLTAVKSGNFVNQMSGKVAGVRVKTSGNMGGSTNIIVRGATSIGQNNQALFVIDGIPMNNDVNNDVNQTTGRRGYDYGNAVSDINPEDIESINVLKGAAATALYGSRAARGVIMITTKKGKTLVTGRRRFGVTLNSNVTMGMIDKSTFPKYQQEYGGGEGKLLGPNPTLYPSYFDSLDVNGDGKMDAVAPTGKDASFGAKFDPNKWIYGWDAFVPESKNYKKATPWVAAGDNGPISFFNKSMSYTNGVAIDGASEKGSFRVSYTNSNEGGVLPNSHLQKQSVSINSNMTINDKLSTFGMANYTNTKALGRNETGYNDNPVSSFRQWMQTSINYQDQREIYEKTKTNFSWNPLSATDQRPAYWDNPYFQRYESYQNDVRDRIYGNIGLNYKLNDMIGLMARVSLDQYSTIQEERVAKESADRAFGITGRARSGYSRFNRNFREINFDFMANFKKNLNENISLSGLLGSNVRRSSFNSILATTTGGITVPKLYTILNSAAAAPGAVENQNALGVNGYFAQASVGYKNFIYIDITARQDYSSTLPVGKNNFFYPGISGSFIFSEKLKNLSWLDFGKARINYANVGNDAPFAKLSDVYFKPIAFGSNALFSLPSIKNNPDLKAEISTTAELGLEMVFFKKRLGFDFAMYNSNTKNQIMDVPVSKSTGYTSMVINAGKIQNKGLELNLYGTPLKTKDFSWTINFNFASNRSKVVELYGDIKNIQQATSNGGASINAPLGEALGVIMGSDFVYLNGKKVISPDGTYSVTPTSDNVLGNVNPKYTAGVTNTLTYKSLSFSFLIDMQRGGSVYSVDMWYGTISGLYEETAGLNELGNPIRDMVANGGGVLLDGVQADGSPNTVRAECYDANNNPWGANTANKGSVFDASYVKLREMSISYNLPLKKEKFFTNAAISIVGSNLWIIHKNLPYADPEFGASAGNFQGIQNGVMPTIRTFGCNLTLQF